jgi:hypothetical protein
MKKRYIEIYKRQLNILGKRKVVMVHEDNAVCVLPLAYISP